MNGIGANLIACFILGIAPLMGFGQESNVQKFKNLSAPEKRWVLAHPFIAKKALRISINARKITRENEKNDLLDQYNNGGKLDAFRHTFWMASLSMAIKWKKAARLGNAHEKGNKIDWKKGRFEEGAPPDRASGEMDYWNNEIGLEIGRKHQGISKPELVEFVLQAIFEGRCKIIRRNDKGAFLDCEGNIVTSSEWKGKWGNSKCLIFSNEAG